MKAVLSSSLHQLYTIGLTTEFPIAIITVKFLKFEIGFQSVSKYLSGIATANGSQNITKSRKIKAIIAPAFLSFSFFWSNSPGKFTRFPYFARDTNIKNGCCRKTNSHYDNKKGHSQRFWY